MDSEEIHAVTTQYQTMHQRPALIWGKVPVQVKQVLYEIEDALKTKKYHSLNFILTCSKRYITLGSVTVGPWTHFYGWGPHQGFFVSSRHKDDDPAVSIYNLETIDAIAALIPLVLECHMDTAAILQKIDEQINKIAQAVLSPKS